MENEKDNIDLLLEGNADEQLAMVDWNGLNSAISGRLGQAAKSKISARRYRAVFKIAAGFIAAAAVVFIAVMVGADRSTAVRLDDGSSAVVKFIDKEGSALVKIHRAAGKSLAMVDIGGGDRKVAKCSIEIIDLNGEREKDGERAAWIIISRPEPVFADNGISTDAMSMICLF